MSSTSIPDAETHHSTITTLWCGNERPNLGTIQALLEGQVEQERVSRRIGNHLLLQQRRSRAKILGWKTIGLIDIPSSIN